VNGVYVHHRLGEDQPLLCRLGLTELLELLEFEQICFAPQAPVWPPSDAPAEAVGGRLQGAGALRLPAAWLRRLRPAGGGEARLPARRPHVLGMQRWYLGRRDSPVLHDTREPAGERVFVESSVRSLGQALLTDAHSCLLLAPVSYKASPAEQSGDLPLPDLFQAPPLRRRERETRALLLASGDRAPSDPGQDTLLKLDVRALVQRVLVARGASACFLALVRHLVQRHVWVRVERV